MISIHVINNETLDTVIIDSSIDYYNTSNLVKSLSHDYDLQDTIKIETNNYMFNAYFDYFITILPSIKDSSLYDMYDEPITDKYIRILAYLSVANFMEDIEVMNFITKIIVDDLTNKESRNKIMENIDEIKKIFNKIPAELDNYIANEIKVNGISYLVEKYGYKEWDFGTYGLSSNENITPEFIEKHINKLVVGKFGLSSNPVVTTEFVEKYINKDWYWGCDGLSCNPNITINFINKYINMPWCTGEMGFSINYGIGLNFIENNINMPWDWGEYGLSKNPIVTPDFIEKHIDMPWNWGAFGLSKNKNITPMFIEKHINKEWDWGELSKNPVIRPDFVIKHLNMPWNWGSDGLPTNPNINLEFMEQFEYNITVYECLGLSGTRIISQSDVEKNLDMNWCWGRYGLSSNPNMTPEFIESHIDENWEWGIRGLSSNPNLTPEFVEKNINKHWKWGARGLSSSKIKDKRFEYVEEYLDYLYYII